jgi:NADH-quinone oxidoreductase subunit G
MPKLTIDGKEVEVAPGTNLIEAARQAGSEVPHYCYHPGLSIAGQCRLCMVDIEKNPRPQISCNMTVADGMVVRTKTERVVETRLSVMEFHLINHPLDCPVCDQAGECYLQDSYMKYGLHDSRVEIEDKVRKRKVVDLGPIMLDAERCVLCSRCLRFESTVTGTNTFEFVNRGDHTSIATFENGPVTHGYAGNLADVCPVGALLSHDFRFKMRVWFLKSHESVCPGCSTGCNIEVDERDGEVQRLRPRRNVDVNKSWMCDIGRASYKEIAAPTRVSGARLRGASSWEGVSRASALDAVAAKLKEAGQASAFLATPQATNEDLFAFAKLADAVKGRLDFRVGDPDQKIRVRSDNVLLREDRNPNTQGCLDQGLGRTGVTEILRACRDGKVKVLVLQGPELLRKADAADALAKVPFIVAMATHEGAELQRAHAVLPAALWAEVEGTFTNYQRRLQRLRRAVPAPGEAAPLWELTAALLDRLGQPLGATSTREVFALVAASVKDYAGLDYKTIGTMGKAVAPPPEAAAGAIAEARA